VGLEYSMKDDKIRILAKGCKYRTFNLGRITGCEFYTGPGPWNLPPPRERQAALTLEITDERNALERALLHFAHFEKQCQRLGDDHYRLRLSYDEADETELVIRILSFGPCVRVTEPAHMADLIKKRLIAQKSCGLK